MIKAGQSVTKTVVLSGQSPFKITEFGRSDDRVSATISDAQKTVHVIPVTIANSGKGGKVNGVLAFRVSSQSKEVKLPFFAEMEQGADVTPPKESSENTPGVQKSDDVPVAPAQTTPESKPAQTPPKELTPAEE